MEISNYIRELLLLNDCVILPGFGGFISQYQPAFIDEEQSAFQPPSKKIVFNSQLIHNDGLLINYISVVNRISYSEAKNLVSDFICNLYIELDKNNTVFFKSLGSFRYDAQHSLYFEAEKNVNLLQDSFGLPMFHFPEIIPIEIPLQNVRPVLRTKSRSLFTNKAFVALIIGLPLLVSFGIVSVKTDLFPELKKKYYALNSYIDDTLSNFKKFNAQDLLNNSNSVEASLLQLTNKRVALYYEETKEKEVSDNQGKVENTIASVDSSQLKTTEKIILPDNNKVKDEVVEKKEIKEAKEISDKKNTDKTVQHNPQKFYLIAGSFGNLNNARNCSNNLKEKGFSPEILQQENGLYRVALKSFSDRKSANNEFTSLQTKSTDFTVWVLSPK
ncbi:MAG: hypothetical protein A2275_10805 [Bacteroidetes bacterium RIFOXYA12_FULL_35_11]|nr:MAG: hypothetical protein A2X01_01785 [Bacteroidetes bacterium GWF2_35_48]OFY75221.1 MAG: hypothetical protein A2275_10805 [Bacteroidetes bacterium RIFOXYA12_FULL_35_11]OFY97005.1 MAG: hypothetical protein A2491_17195 [Bacteroidetes bacterium RIFOXYC12_FULL_35_7]